LNVSADLRLFLPDCPLEEQAVYLSILYLPAAVKPFYEKLSGTAPAVLFYIKQISLLLPLLFFFKDMHPV